MEYLHDRRIAHRDIKLGNLFVDTNNDNNLKIISFGQSKLIETLEIEVLETDF